MAVAAAFVFAAGAVVLGCSGSFASGDDIGPNPEAISLPVLASAGADREVLRGFTARLDGSGTYSPTAKSFTVHWEQLGAGTGVILSNPSALTPTFLAPLEEEILHFRITADDGTTTTYDEVALHVRRQPAAQAPRLTAGADRLAIAADDAPGPGDVVGVVPADVSIGWEVVQPDTAGARLSDGGGSAAQAIYRLTATRTLEDERYLEGAPDYLLLLDPAELSGDQAPVAHAQAPELVDPGESFVLDAAASTDVNGDTLRVRWEQVQGTPLFTDTPSTTEVEVSAPARADELVFRAYVSDGQLESAPAQVIVRVEPETAPVVAPQGDARTHEGNWVLLDADGIPTPTENPEVTFTWLQTYGPEVALTFDDNGRYAQFAAPAEHGDLAFVVVATLGAGGAGGVESDPAVARVTVVATLENDAPDIYLCSEKVTTPSGPRVVVTAKVDDPEGDGLGVPTWYAEIQGTPVQMVERAAGDIVLTAVCDPTQGGGLGTAVLFQAEAEPPPASYVLDVDLTACDDLAACGTSSVAAGPY